MLRQNEVTMDEDEAMQRFRTVWTPEQIEVLERWATTLGTRLPNWSQLKQLRAELRYKGRVRTETRSVRVLPSGPPYNKQQRRRLKDPAT
jgi:hypothetical protein